MTGLTISPRTRRRLNNRALDALTWLVLAVMLAPIFWLVAASMQNKLRLSTGELDLLHPTLNAFGAMWETVDFQKYFVNSLVICGAAAALATAFAASAGYALARFRFRGARPFGLAVVGTQLIPGSMFLLPIFMGFIWLKQNTPVQLFDSQLGMVLVYTAFFTPVAIYFMRSFFLALPRELEDAAMVDGCSQFGAFVRIVLPNALPGTRRDLRLRVPVRVGRAAVRRRAHADARGDDPDRDPQLHRQLLAGVRPADGGGRRLDAAGAARVLLHPALARARADRRGGEGMSFLSRCGDRRVPGRGRGAGGRPRRLDLGRLLPACRARWRTATAATSRATTTGAGAPTST